MKKSRRYYYRASSHSLHIASVRLVLVADYGNDDRFLRKLAKVLDCVIVATATPVKYAGSLCYEDPEQNVQLGI
jgi:hypothetical protein